MKIDLRSILHGVRDFEFLVTSDWWEANCRDGSVIGLAAPMNVRIEVSSAASKYLLDGHLTGDVVLQCDRCLESYTYHLDTGFRLALIVRQGEDGQTEVELFREDLEKGFVDDLIIDLAEITREQVFLALPMKNLCREDCAGLCPICGTNLNRETCQCGTAEGHPGFSKLRELGNLRVQRFDGNGSASEGNEAGRTGKKPRAKHTRNMRVKRS
jgi:uncharacterized protein